MRSRRPVTKIGSMRAAQDVPPGTVVTVTRKLSPVTDEGARFVRLCEEHAAVFATRAGEHDRAGSFGFENWEDLKASGALRACIPAELGGLGVMSLHDLAVGISRLAQGDASMAIGANMHMSLPWGFTRHWLAARARGDVDAEGQWGATLQVFGTMVFCGPNTEPGNNVGILPATTAKPVEGGYLVTGRKIFGTNAPVADIFGFWVSLPDDGTGRPMMASATVPRGTAGMTVHDDWDALGMRASGSCSVSFEDCFIPAGFVRTVGVSGEWGADFLMSLLAIAFPLVATFVGIAEAALDEAKTNVVTRRRGPSECFLGDRHGIQQLIAEAEVELSAARACLVRAGRLIDDYYAVHHPEQASEADLHQLMVEFQCANVVVKRGAIAVIDKTMTAVGGSSYGASSPLARHWRDVRAGAFMQPFSPVEAFRYIASVALGREPLIDD